MALDNIKDKALAGNANGIGSWLRYFTKHKVLDEFICKKGGLG